MNRLGRHIVCAFMAAVLVIGSVFVSYAKPDWPNDTGVQSEAGIVVDFDSEAVLFGQGIHERKAPASITKILTALVVIENADLDEEVTYSHEAVYDVEGGSGNKLNIEEGDKLTVRECLYLLLLQSSNQTANALAEHVGGSMEGFVAMMNEKIAELGCTDSHFANPSGLNSDEQYVSAYDMFKIAKAAYSNETLLEINSTLSQKISPTINNPGGPTVKMEHKLLITEDPTAETYYPYAVAGKTGYTQAAGQTLVTYAVKDDRRLISVTLRSTQTTHYIDTIALLDFGFNEFSNFKIAEHDDLLSGSKVTIGDKEYKTSDLSWDQDAVITLPNGAEFTDADRTIETDLGENVPDGQVAVVRYTYNDRVIGKTTLFSESKKAADEKARKDAEAAAAAAAASEEAARQSSEAAATTSPETTAGAPAGSGFKLPELNLTKEEMVTYSLASVAGILLFALIIFLLLRKKHEKDMAEARLQRRRERLAELGVTEEEFRGIVEERREVIAERNEAAEAAVIAASGMDVVDFNDDEDDEDDADDAGVEDIDVEDVEPQADDVDVTDMDTAEEDIDAEDIDTQEDNIDAEDMDSQDDDSDVSDADSQAADIAEENV